MREPSEAAKETILTLEGYTVIDTGDPFEARRQMLGSRSAFHRPSSPPAPRPGFGPL